MIWFLNKKSLLNRKFTSLIVLISISLCTLLFVGIEKVREGVKEGFTNTISQTDLIVGAKGGPLQLLLYSVFHLGSPTSNIRYSSFEKMAKNPKVKWAIPISLGDSYRGYRVIGTDQNFYEYFRFHGEGKIVLARGEAKTDLFSVVLGSEVAKNLKHKLNDRLIITHGLSEASSLKHDQTPFYVSGILKPTYTPIDRSVLVTLKGVEAMHIGWETGIPDESKQQQVHTLRANDIEVKQITSMLLGTQNRIYTLRLSHEISNFEDEPLMAIMPGIVLAELWQTVGNVEKILLFMSGCILIVGLLGILIALFSSLNERRREMAILRSLGVGSLRIGALLISESLFLVLSGMIVGTVLSYGSLYFLRNWMAERFGIYFTHFAPTQVELCFFLVSLILSVLIGSIPAYRAYKLSLKDGLAIRI